MKKVVFCSLLAFVVALSMIACNNSKPIICANCSAKIPSNSQYCSSCGAAVSLGNTTNTEESIDDNYPFFEGVYTNDGKSQSNKTIRKILSTIEEDTKLNGVTYGDIIYHYVDNRNDCFPSANNPVYSVITDVSNGTVLNAGTYEVTYIIGVGNSTAIDLFFSVPYDFSSVSLIELTVRIIGGGNTLYSYWYEDWTKEEMENAMLTTVSQYMPDISFDTKNDKVDIYYSGIVEAAQESLSGWKISLTEGITVWDASGAHTCDTLYFYADAKLGGQPISVYEEKTITLYGTPENYRDGGDFYIFDPVLVSVDTDSNTENISNQNFENKVSLIKKDSWYDNGIFSAYFNSCNYGNDTTWNYIGSSHDVFNLDYLDYATVDVYKVTYPNRMPNYYFVPYHDVVGNAPVVFVFLEDGQKPTEVWSGIS